MDRRRFCGIAATTSVALALGFRRETSLACDIERNVDPDATPAPDDPVDSVTTLFRWPVNNDLRSVAIRIRQWSDPDLAASNQNALMEAAGPDMPEGEFYATDTVELDVPDRDEDDSIGLVGWTTTVGVAAYQTGYALLSIQRGTILWDATITAASLDHAAGFAPDLHSILLDDLTTCSLIDGFLPDVNDMPAGATEETYG